MLGKLLLTEVRMMKKMVYLPISKKDQVLGYQVLLILVRFLSREGLLKTFCLPSYSHFVVHQYFDVELFLKYPHPSI